nr:PREDICTED: zinc finger HIT domain-containing protein 3 [Megachile rotundata]
MSKICCICSKTDCSYKCPTCKVPYCSVGCYKGHKESNCQPEDPKQHNGNEDEITYDFPTEDTVPIEKLEQLRYSEELKNCLRNPHVRDIMRAILTDKNPTKVIALAMTEPIFVEMADACLKVVEPPVDDQPC